MQEPALTFDAWLRLREPADADARSAELVERLLTQLPDAGPLVVHDLGCGSGSMARWLAPRLPGPQHWVMHDRDPNLLALAAADAPDRAAGGALVTAETRRDDIIRLPADALAGASLVTASALLDMFARPELERFVDSCLATTCPVLVTLSVTGEVELDPADPLDDEVRDAFNAHQRRSTAAGALLGPEAAGTAAGLFRAGGRTVVTDRSPWRLGPSRSDLLAAWFRGWVGAAVEQEPALADDLAPWVERRLGQVAAGGLRVVVPHEDLLALPAG